MGQSDSSRRPDDTTVRGRVGVPSAAEPVERRPFVTVLAGPLLGRSFEMTPTPLVFGRGRTADVAVEDESVSRQHASFRLESDGVVVEDLGSTNGTFVHGQRITRRALQDGDRVRLGSELVLKLAHLDAMECRFQQELYDAATHDGLTGVLNQRALLQRLKEEQAFSRRSKAPLALCLLDVDGFKGINDRYGHPAGDAVLCQLPRVVSSAIRVEDVLGRYGGDEFAIVLRAIPPDQAHVFVDRIRRTVAGAAFCLEDDGHGPPRHASLTISSGLALYDRHAHRTAEDLVREADRHLYRAKHAGGNRVVSPFEG